MLVDGVHALFRRETLLFLVVVAAGFVLVIRKGFGGQESWDIREREPDKNRILEASADAISPLGNPEKYVRALCAFGKRDAVRQGDVLVFRANAGWRYGFLAGCGAISLLLVHEGLHTPTAWIAFF